MTIETFLFDSQAPGPDLLVLGGVHGNETAGTDAATRLAAELKSGGLTLKSGTLTLAPVCNPRARGLGRRQTEENLNRVVKHWDAPDTYEKRLGCEVAGLIDRATDVLDIHSTYNRNDPPFAFMDYPTERNKTKTRCAPVDIVLAGWPDVYGDSPVEDFTTESYANMAGKSCITVECGWHEAPDAADIAFATILNYMRSAGMLDGAPTFRENQKFIRMRSLAMKTSPGRFARDYKHLDPLKAGDAIAELEDGRTITADRDSYIILPKPYAAVGEEWYYLGE